MLKNDSYIFEANLMVIEAYLKKKWYNEVYYKSFLYLIYS